MRYTYSTATLESISKHRCPRLSEGQLNLYGLKNSRRSEGQLSEKALKPFRPNTKDTRRCPRKDRLSKAKFSQLLNWFLNSIGLKNKTEIGIGINSDSEN